MMLILLATPVMAQEFLRAGNGDPGKVNSIIKNPRVGYGYCEDNQIAIYNKLISDSKKQINRLTIIIDEARAENLSKNQMKFYHKKMYDLVLNQVILTKMKQHIQNKGLYNLIEEAKRTKSVSVLQLDKIEINLEIELITSLEKSLNQKTWNQVHSGSIDYINDQLFNEILLKLAGGTKVFVSNEVKRQIGLFFAGEISKQMLSRAVRNGIFKLGKNLLKDVASGSLVDILAIPFQAYMQAPENELVDLMADVPELIINPEWINPQNSLVPTSIHWRTHCLASLRQPKRIEYELNKFRNEKLKNFNQELDVLRYAKTIKKDFKTPPRSKQSSTRTHRDLPAVILKGQR